MASATATDITPARVGPPARLLGSSAKLVDNRADIMASRIYRWMQRYARSEAQRQMAAFEQSAAARYVFGKSDPVSRRRLELELLQILESEGVAMFSRSTKRTTGMRSVGVTDKAMRDFMGQKRIKLQQIMRTTHRAVTDSVRQIILTAVEEVPRPTANELGRRIARVYHGDAGGQEIERVRAPLRNSRVLPTERVKLTPEGNLYHFSFERAHLIARTELAQAENEGIFEGYRQTGVKGLKWLAYNDGRSGGREHNEMNGVETPIGVPFIMPDRTPMRFPGDPRGPIRHLANCRCTTAPVFIL